MLLGIIRGPVDSTLFKIAQKANFHPQADIPAMQLSIDETRPASFHHEIGRRIAPLREEGILIVGSGNLVHNLHP